MIVANIAQQRTRNQVWTCASIPTGRLCIIALDGMALYIRADGTTEAFDWTIDYHKYTIDTSWELIGSVPRFTTDGSINITALSELMS